MDLNEEMDLVCFSSELKQPAAPGIEDPEKDLFRIGQHLLRKDLPPVPGHQHSV